MPSAQNRGFIQTVLGPIAPSELGPTTTHEHLYIDFSFMFRPAQDSPSQELADAPITLENLGWIRRNYYSNRSKHSANGRAYHHRRTQDVRRSRRRRDCGRDHDRHRARPPCAGPNIP